MASSDWNAISGLRLAAVSAGIKTEGRLDLVLLELPQGSAVAGTFTRNAFCAAPVQIAKSNLSQAAPRYLLVNTGNANAGTGEQGLLDAQRSCDAVAELCAVEPSQVLPFSTGVIGEHLPMDRLLAALPAAKEGLSAENWPAAAEGILTTDTRPKLRSRSIKLGGESVHITGIAKGAGMIRPNMATMLAYLATDAAIAEPLLQQLWSEVVEGSFNRVTIDGDTSTNDAAIMVATAAAGNECIDSAAHPDYADFSAALHSLALELAQELVRDGEGASKFVEVKVVQGKDASECLEVAYTVAHSPLVKTALFASDPNWGRILAAIGRAEVSELDVEKIEVLLNGVLIAERGGRAASYTEEQGVAAMAEDDICIEIRLHRGESCESVWTSDFSYDYVRINAEYRT